MINREIYTFALHLLAQHEISEDTADFEERAPYLIAACCIEAQTLDTALRKSQGLPPADAFTGVYLALDGAFPLHQGLASLAGFYLAAMLILDEDSELSDKLYAHYCDGMATLQASLEKEDKPNSPEENTPWLTESIGEAYFYD